MKILSKNKRAYYDYEILDKYEAGIALYGWEVKSARAGQINLKEGFVTLKKGEVFLVGVNISKWKTQSAKELVNTTRWRKLLLQKSQIKRLETEMQATNLTLVPLQAYLANNQKIKIEIGIARGKKKYEKREKVSKEEFKKGLKNKEDQRW